MEVSFTFRNVESSEAVKNYAREKLTRLQKYVRSPLRSDVIFSHERHLHRVEVVVGGDGHRYTGTHESGDMYASIDLVFDKINRQLRKHNGGVTQMSGKNGGGNEF
jgi:putative sigma-54 modulation protein